MSTSNESKLDFANMVLNHHALEAVIEDVHQRLFARFRVGTEQERKIVADIMDAGDLFIKELKTIVDQHAKSETVDDKIQPID